MGGKDKQRARRFCVTVEKAGRGPGRNQHGMARADRHPLAAELRVQFACKNDDGQFGMWIDRSWYPGIGRDSYFFDMEGLAALVGAYENASLEPWGNPRSLVQTLFIDDWHLSSLQ